METENQSEIQSLATWLENISSGISAQKAASELRRLHAKVQKLEAMLESVVAGGVSAQRVTQADTWDEEREKLLRALYDRGYEDRAKERDYDPLGASEFDAAMCAGAPPEMVAAPAELNLDDYYCKGCGRIGEMEELSAQDKAMLRKLGGKPKTAAALVVLPEPDEYQYRMRGNWDDKPLTDEQIGEILKNSQTAEQYKDGWYLLPHSFARAIEKAHGIGDTNGNC